MNTQELKGYFYRLFLGLVKVNSLPVSMALPQVFSQKREIEARSIDIPTLAVDVFPMQMQAGMKVTASKMLADKGISCSSRGFRFSAQLIKVRESKITRYTPKGTALHTFAKLETKAHEATKYALVLPQERTNRLQWQTERPKREGEMILAWFGPIVEDAVAKLTLNKRQGTLLIWYNPQSRHFNVKGLYLYRRLGINENLEWRWV